MTNVDWFIRECEAIIALWSAGLLGHEFLEIRFNLAAEHYGVA